MQILQITHVTQRNEVVVQGSGKMSENGKAKAQKSWFKNLKAEFKKIIWPDKKTIAKETAAVVAVTIILGLIISLLDFIITHGVDLLVNL